MSPAPLHRASVTASMLIPDPARVQSVGPEADTRPVPDRRKRGVRSGVLISSTCAILIPIVATIVAQVTEGGAPRILLTWLIALLMGLALYASAASHTATRRPSPRAVPRRAELAERRASPPTPGSHPTVTPSTPPRTPGTTT